MGLSRSGLRRGGFLGEVVLALERAMTVEVAVEGLVEVLTMVASGWFGRLDLVDGRW